MRVGVIGLGWIGGRHVALLGRLAGTDVVAVCDSDEQRMMQVARVTGATPYRSWEALVDHRALDAVFVCTPPAAHRGPAVAALGKGISVFLEKPIARTIEDAVAIANAVKASDAVCAVGYQWHGLELLDDLRRALDGQTLGLQLGRILAPTESRPWFVDRAQSGGDMLERATHVIDLERFVGGEVATVQAATSQGRLVHAKDPEADIDDVIALTLRFEDGHLGTVHIGWTREDLPALHRLDVVASDGVLQLDLGPEYLLRGRSSGVDVYVRATRDPFDRTVERFLDAAARRDPGLVFCTAEDAKRTLAVALACERAVERARSVCVAELLEPAGTSAGGEGAPASRSEDAVAREGL